VLGHGPQLLLGHEPGDRARRRVDGNHAGRTEAAALPQHRLGIGVDVGMSDTEPGEIAHPHTL
jgi:hypothetical protein